MFSLLNTIILTKMCSFIWITSFLYLFDSLCRSSHFRNGKSTLIGWKGVRLNVFLGVVSAALLSLNVVGTVWLVRENECIFDKSRPYRVSCIHNAVVYGCFLVLSLFYVWHKKRSVYEKHVMEEDVWLENALNLKIKNQAS